MTVAVDPARSFSRMQLGRLGLWTFQLDLQPMSRSREAVAELEELGFGCIWVPEAVGREPFANASLRFLTTPTRDSQTSVGVSTFE